MKYVFIGAGVSTVFAVMKMLDNGIEGKDILLIDKGKNPYDRQPSEVMCGFFGAGAWSDGKIIYSFTQGGELIEYTGEEKGKQLIKELKYYIRAFHPNPEAITSTGIAQEPDFIKESDLELKQNECEHIGTDYLRQMGKSIYDYFTTNGVSMIFETEVETTWFEENKIQVAQTTLNERRGGSISYENLIIATGKSGMDFITDLIETYNLPSKPKNMQIGVRFESDYKYFKKLAVEFHDFKLYKKYNDKISCRTFCVNNKAAYVAIEDVHGMKSFNGHGYKDESKYNGLTNFGVMLEVKGINNPLETAKELVAECQIYGKGMYYTPGNRKPNVEVTECDLDYFYDIYQNLAYNIMDFIRELNTIFEFGEDYIIYLPEVKYLTNEILVNHKDLSLTNYPNVHIMGDALSGRGIFVSACQGLYLSESFINKNNI